MSIAISGPTTVPLRPSVGREPGRRSIVIDNDTGLAASDIHIRITGTARLLRMEIDRVGTDGKPTALATAVHDGNAATEDLHADFNPPYAVAPGDRLRLAIELEPPPGEGDTLTIVFTDEKHGDIVSVVADSFDEDGEAPEGMDVGRALERLIAAAPVTKPTT